MRTVFATLISATMLAVVAGAVFIYSGVFNVAATEPHWAVTYWLMEKARIRSIETHAAGIVPPRGYDEQAKIVGAVSHFSEHCATCHGGPGVRRGDLAEGMYPEPPELTNVSSRYTPGELFWILKNGIKMSAMPSMASDGDDMLWATVAFLEKLPNMSDDDYNDLWMASQAQGGHAGMNMDHGSMTMPMDHGSMGMQGMAAPPGGAAGEGATAPSGTPAPSTTDTARPGKE